MNLRRFYLVGTALLAIEVALSAWGLAVAGPETRVAIHWGIDGEPDGFAPALVAFLIGPAVTAGS